MATTASRDQMAETKKVKVNARMSEELEIGE